MTSKIKKAPEGAWRLGSFPGYFKNLITHLSHFVYLPPVMVGSLDFIPFWVYCRPNNSVRIVRSKGQNIFKVLF